MEREKIIKKLEKRLKNRRPPTAKERLAKAEMDARQLRNALADVEFRRESLDKYVKELKEQIEGLRKEHAQVVYLNVENRKTYDAEVVKYNAKQAQHEQVISAQQARIAELEEQLEQAQSRDQNNGNAGGKEMIVEIRLREAAS